MAAADDSCPVILIVIVWAMLLGRSLSLLSLGEDVAANLGVKTRQVRILGMAAAVLLAGVSVSAVGSIGFVGLVIPHIARKLVGVNYRFVIPMSAILGSVLLVFADLASRTVNPPRACHWRDGGTCRCSFLLIYCQKRREEPVMREKQRALVVTVVLLCLTAAVVLYSLNTGTLKLSPLVVVKTLFGFGDFQSETVLFDYRLPRIVVTMLAGIGLGIAGGILQSLSRNPLADPGIIGLNAGAAFGLIVFVTYFHALEGNPSLLIPLFTFGGGLLAAAVIVLLAYNRQEGLVPSG